MIAGIQYFEEILQEGSNLASQKQLVSPNLKKALLTINQGLKSYRNWSAEENREYAKCLNELRDDFTSQRKRRTSQVFKVMSKTLKIKSPAQCRSHHQKMIIKYGSITNIIACLFDNKQCSPYNQEKGSSLRKSELNLAEFQPQKINSDSYLAIEHYCNKIEGSLDQQIGNLFECI